jgi:hypothetical protein
MPNLFDQVARIARRGRKRYLSLSLANHHASLPVAYRLYLPKDWAGDTERRRKVGVPDDIGFKTKHDASIAEGRKLLSVPVMDGVATPLSMFSLLVTALAEKRPPQRAIAQRFCAMRAGDVRIRRQRT